MLGKGNKNQKIYHIWENTKDRQHIDGAHCQILVLTPDSNIMLRDTSDCEKINDLPVVDATIKFCQILAYPSAVCCMWTVNRGTGNVAWLSASVVVVVLDCDDGRGKDGSGSGNGGGRCVEGCVVAVLVMVVVIVGMEVSSRWAKPEAYRYDVSLQGNHVKGTEWLWLRVKVWTVMWTRWMSEWQWMKTWSVDWRGICSSIWGYVAV